MSHKQEATNAEEYRAVLNEREAFFGTIEKAEHSQASSIEDVSAARIVSIPTQNQESEPHKKSSEQTCRAWI